MKSNPMVLNEAGYDLYGVHISQHMESKKACPSDAARLRGQVDGPDLADTNGVSIHRLAGEVATRVEHGGSASLYFMEDGSQLYVGDREYEGYIL